MPSASPQDMVYAQAALCSDIEQAIAHLRRLTQCDVQHLWEHCADDLSLEQVLAESCEWAIAPLNDRHHVAWSRGRNVLWLRQHIRIPNDLNRFPLDGLTLRLG
ncbi:MAG: hypothetical protein AAFR31_22380, partial [Cyanobacteria bacterium J06627_8]